MAGLLAAWLRLAQLSRKWKIGKRAENEAMTDVRGLHGSTTAWLRVSLSHGCKGGVDDLGELEEVGVGCVGSPASEDSLQKVGELCKGPRLVRKNEITVTLNVHLVVQNNLSRLVVFVDDLGLV